ncbi:helix-turn-helix transcriptional regulator [Clostridium sp.]|uniref:helix-turn-helix transcriptional regulator n=1 Tax=Clostridium sp. TaxID=1506 RepID=UPI003D6D6495
MQINRLFEIVYILLDKKIVTSKELAERFEVSTRTVYRDIETLSSAGIPVYMSKGKGGGISLLSDFVLNKAVLTEKEKANIISSLKAVSSVNLSESDTALEKLSSLFGETNTDWIEVDFTSWYNEEEEKELFCNLKSAILSKNTILFSYSSGKGENIKRQVYPLKLCFKGQSWYLYGYCKIRCDNRFFKLRRIKSLSVLDETFHKRPPAQVFSKKNIFKEDFITLTLKLSKEMTYRIYDEFSTFEQLYDGSFIVEIIFPKGDWIFNYITSFGENCEVLSPEEVRLDVKAKLQNILKNYL